MFHVICFQDIGNDVASFWDLDNPQWPTVPLMRRWWYASKITPPSFVSKNHLLIWLRAAPISPDGISFHVHLCECFPKPLEGGWDCLMPYSCLQSQGCHLIPFSYLLSSSSTYSSCTVFLSCNFCNNFPFSLLFSKIFSNICVWDRPFCLPIVFDPSFRKSLMYFLKVFINWTFIIRVSAGLVGNMLFYQQMYMSINECISSCTLVWKEAPLCLRFCLTLRIMQVVMICVILNAQSWFYSNKQNYWIQSCCFLGCFVQNMHVVKTYSVVL